MRTRAAEAMCEQRCNDSGSRCDFSSSQGRSADSDDLPLRNREVTRVNFEGCIQDLELDTRLLDLHKTKEALAVTSGCPAIVSAPITTSGTVLCQRW